jgi:hypothetical protein
MLIGFEAELRPLFDRRAKHVATRDVRNLELFDKTSRLGALPCSRRADEDHAHPRIQPCATMVCNAAAGLGILGEAMVEVPRWYCAVAHVFAVAFAVWLGLHLYAPLEWVAIFVVAATLSALLPYFRVVGFIGIVCGIAIAGAGTYLLRDVWHALSLDGLLSSRGGVLGGGREAVVLALASLWLVLGSAFRTQRA